jgi:predicted O-methyltransferase YrrM
MPECLSHPALEKLPQGWFHHGQKILELLEEHKPKTCVELGSWKGASAIAMARVLRKWGGTLTCVDTWAAEAFHGGITEDDAHPRPKMLTECACNLVAAGVSASVRLVVAPSLEAATYWSEPIDFLYIDADHEYAQVLADLEAWVPHVRPGGWIAGDDYANPGFPGVRMAWNYYELEHGLTFQRWSTPNTNPPGMQLIYGQM